MNLLELPMSLLEFLWRKRDAGEMDSPRCFRCGKQPNELLEYTKAAHEAGVSPDEFVRQNEGTLNDACNTFACTDCYNAIGSPSSAKGWRAPPLAGITGRSLLGRNKVGGES